MKGTVPETKREHSLESSKKSSFKEALEKHLTFTSQRWMNFMKVIPAEWCRTQGRQGRREAR